MSIGVLAGGMIALAIYLLIFKARDGKMSDTQRAKGNDEFLLLIAVMKNFKTDKILNMTMEKIVTSNQETAITKQEKKDEKFKKNKTISAEKTRRCFQ